MVRFATLQKRILQQTQIQARYGILFYARFKDDWIIIATCNRQDLVDFTAKFKQKSAPFQLKFEVHRETTTMMDVTLEKGQGWRKTGRLDYKLYTKPSSQWQPLLSSSFHHPSVHLAWPTGQLCRIRRRCSEQQTANREVRRFCEQYHRHTGLFVQEETRAKTMEVKPSPMLPRLILPYRTAWDCSRISHICRRVWQKCGMETFTGEKADLQICWQLPNKHLLQQIRQKNLQNVHGGERGWKVGKSLYFCGRDSREEWNATVRAKRIRMTRTNLEAEQIQWRRSRCPIWTWFDLIDRYARSFLAELAKAARVQPG